MLIRLRLLQKTLAPFLDPEAFSSRTALPLLSLFAFLLVLRVFTPQLYFTGDEPHYASQAIALFSHFLPMLSEHEVWHRFLAASGIFPSPIPESEIGSPLEYRQSFITSLVFAAPLVAFNLQAARWLDFGLAIVAVLFLFQFISSANFAKENKVSERILNVLAIAVATLSLPFLAYTNLLYPEILLLLAVCITLRCLQMCAVNSTIISAVVLAFIYIRALPLSIAFFAVLLWTLYKSGIAKSILYRVVLKYVAGILLLLLLQVILYGSVTAGGTTSFSPSLLSLPERIGVQLFDIRHGLLAYSPIFFIAIAGLVSGTLRRNVVCQQAGFLCLVYVLTFCWASAAESWTARYWIVALPFLTIGLRYWISSVNAWVSLVPTFPLFLVTVANSIMFVVQPNRFLANRAGSITYAELFDISKINLSLYLPVDVPMPYFVSTVPYLLMYSIVVITSLASISMARGRRSLYAAIALVVVLVPFGMCYLDTLPSSDYRVISLPAAAGIDIALQSDQTRISAVQFNDTFNFAWTGMPENVNITCSDQQGSIRVAKESMRSLIALANCYRDIKIVAEKPPSDSSFQRRIRNVSLLAKPF